MNGSKPMRAWCALIAYPDLKPVLFGTAHVRNGAPEHEVEAEMTVVVRSCLPDGWALKELLPGSVFFAPENG